MGRVPQERETQECPRRRRDWKREDTGGDSDGPKPHAQHRRDSQQAYALEGSLVPKRDRRDDAPVPQRHEMIVQGQAWRSMQDLLQAAVGEDRRELTLTVEPVEQRRQLCLVLGPRPADLEARVSRGPRCEQLEASNVDAADQAPGADVATGQASDRTVPCSQGRQ